MVVVIITNCHKWGDFMKQNATKQQLDDYYHILININNILYKNGIITLEEKHFIRNRIDKKCLEGKNARRKIEAL